MSPISPSILRTEYLTNPANEETSKEILERFYELAPLYNAELTDAQNHDDNRPPRTSEVPYQQWLEDNPRQRSTVESRWNDRLNITNTNNFYMWFRDKDDLIGHKIDDPETLDIKPALIDLVKLKNADPEFFAACQEAANTKLSYMRMDVNQNDEVRSEDKQLQHTLDNIVSTWVCELYMQEVINRLTDVGLSQEAISTLF